MIWGNGIPVILENSVDASWLPQTAWTDNRGIVFDMAINIAMTALRRMGVPYHMAQLQFYWIFQSNYPLKMAVDNKKRWSSIVEKERALRLVEGDVETPLYVMHPA